MKINFSTLVTLSLMALPVGAQSAQQLRIATSPHFPPFESKTPDGQLVGFEIDLGNELCARLKMRCVWQETSFDGLIPSLKAKNVDAIISAFSITEDRLKTIAFTDKLFNTPVYLAVKKGSTLTATAESLKGKRIGTERNSIFETYARKFWIPKGVNMFFYPNSDVSFSDLQAGRLDGIVSDAVVLKSFFEKKPGGQNYMITQPEVYDAKIFGRGAGIGLRQEDQALRLRLNQAIQEIHKDGTYNRLAKKYFDFDVYGK